MWLDDYFEAYTATLTASDYGGWQPFDPFTFWPVYGRQWLDRLWQAKETAQQQGKTPTDLSKGFLGLVTLRIELHTVPLMAKSCNYDKEKTMKLMNWFNDILCAKASEDPYGFNSTKIHEYDDVKQMLTLLPFHTAAEGEAREIAKLAHACKELSWSLYTDFHYTQWFEIFGPYDAGNGKQLLLQAFTNFEPKEIWPDYAGFEPNNVYIYTVYEGAEIKLDQWSHATSTGQLPAKMRKVFILAHTKIIETPEQLKELRERMEAAAVSQGQRVKQMDFEGQKQWLVNAHCYTYRDLFNLLGLDWKPSVEMLEVVKGKPLLTVEYPEFKTLEEKKEFWKKLFDPRDDFFLEGLKQ